MEKLILEVVRKIRTERKLSQEDVAAGLNMSQSAYAKIERGETNLTIRHFLNICTFLAVDPSELFRHIYKNHETPDMNYFIPGIHRVMENQNENMIEIKQLLLELRKN